MNHKWFLICCALCALLVCASIVLAKGPMVSALGNRHNLSAQNTGVKYYAVDNPVTNPAGQQICIFCHTPHSSSSQGPLWNRSDTKQVFARYTSSTLRIKNLPASQYSNTGDSGGQPNGSSRLCLSCHDGVTPLGGDAVSGGVIRSGQSGPILMNATGGDKITGVASFDPSTTNKMKVGHHPVSFVYATSFDYKTQNGTMIGLNGASFTIPKLSTQPQMADKVKLQDTKRDARGWMQCTTCHDAHQNMGNDVTTYPSTTRKVVPFWVYSGASAVGGHDAVCNSCHKLAVITPAPWP